MIRNVNSLMVYNYPAARADENIDETEEAYNEARITDLHAINCPIWGPSYMYICSISGIMHTREHAHATSAPALSCASLP